MTELVSVVMATFNGEKFLRAQIDSILNQSYSNIELVAVDDASTDNTLGILFEYASIDNRVKVYNLKKNIGFICNFERGINLSKGEYIVLADQDDIFRNDKISLLLKVLLENSACDLAISDLSLIDDSDFLIADSMWKKQKRNPPSGHPFKHLAHENFANGCAMMMRRKLLTKILPFPANCIVHDWWIAIVAASERSGGICLVNESLTYYRQHDFNLIGCNERDPISIFKNLVILFVNQGASERYSVRKNDLIKQISRINGYLSVDIWSSNDKAYLLKYKCVLENLLNDEHNRIFKRISFIPQRIVYSMATRSIRQIAEVLYFSIFPLR